MISDVKCGIRWLRSLAATHNIDPNRIGIMGKSSGAHLAMMAALTDDETFSGNGSHQEYSSTVNAIVDWYGPADMVQIYNDASGLEKTQLSGSIGGTPVSNLQAYKDLSPMYNVSSSAPPIWMSHGDSDGTVPHEHSEKMEIALSEMVVPYYLQTMSGEGHSLSVPATDIAREKMWLFFYSILSP